MTERTGYRISLRQYPNMTDAIVDFYRYHNVSERSGNLVLALTQFARDKFHFGNETLSYSQDLVKVMIDC
jgi:hypothetical protein